MKKSGRGGISLSRSLALCRRRFFAKGVVSVNGHGGGSRGPVLAREADPREWKKNWPDPVSAERNGQRVWQTHGHNFVCMLARVNGHKSRRLLHEDRFLPMAAAHAARGYFARRRRGPNVTGQPVIKSET